MIQSENCLNSKYTLRSRAVPVLCVTPLAANFLARDPAENSTTRLPDRLEDHQPTSSTFPRSVSRENGFPENQSSISDGVMYPPARKNAGILRFAQNDNSFLVYAIPNI